MFARLIQAVVVGWPAAGHRRSQVEGAAMYRPLVSQLDCMWSNRKPKDNRKEENQ